jgi:hypothetical protein
MIGGNAFVFVASSNGTDKDACVRFAEGLAVSSHSKTFP